MAEEARKQLQVGAPRKLFATLGREENQGRPAYAVSHETRVQQAIRAQAIQVTSHRLRTDVKRFCKLGNRRFSPAADEAQNLLPSCFHV
jgi:hypothetical protein